MALVLDGNTKLVSGVYAITKIIQQGGSALPVFNLGVIVGEGVKGVPYLVGSGTPTQTADQFILPFTNATDLQKQAGLEGDSKAVTFFRYAKKMGAGTIYYLNVRPLTKFSGGTVANVTPAPAITIASRDYGAFVNHTSLTIATSIHTIIPPKNATLLTADSGTGKNIFVGDASRIKSGDTWLLADNVYAGAPQSLVVDTVNYVTNEVVFTTAVTVSALAANYATLFQEDLDNKEVSGTLDTIQKVTAFYATSKILTATQVGSISIMPVTLAKTAIRLLTSATLATTPATTATDWQAVCDNFQRWNTEFAQVNGVYIRVIGITTTDATNANHVAFRDMATAQRAINRPVAIIGGCAVGDYLTATSAATNPINRAKALNSDDFQLAGFGIDGYAGAHSLAGEIFGIRLANNINHNQTNDDILATTVEKSYDFNDPSIQAYAVAGVMTIKSTKIGYKLLQGVTTYQDQSTTFNPDTKKTYLVANRDVADFDLRAQIEVLDGVNGQDGVTKDYIISAMTTVGDLLVSSGIILSYTIDSVTKTGNAWTVKRTVSIGSPTDFIGLINTILVN